MLPKFNASTLKNMEITNKFVEITSQCHPYFLYGCSQLFKSMYAISSINNKIASESEKKNTWVRIAKIKNENSIKLISAEIDVC